jgi:hypothetical protein
LFQQTQETLTYITNYGSAPDSFKKVIQNSFPNKQKELQLISGKIKANLLPIQTVGTQ